MLIRIFPPRQPTDRLLGNPDTAAPSAALLIEAPIPLISWTVWHITERYDVNEHLVAEMVQSSFLKSATKVAPCGRKLWPMLETRTCIPLLGPSVETEMILCIHTYKNNAKITEISGGWEDLISASLHHCSLRLRQPCVAEQTRLGSVEMKLCRWVGTHRLIRRDTIT